MTNDRIKELALANGFKLKEQPDGSMDLNPYVFDFANALLAEAKPGWMPITKELLEEFESTVSGECFLLGETGYKYVAIYEWREGRNPHGFTDADGRWYPANHFTKIMINP
jgi:hypothetical protein